MRTLVGQLRGARAGDTACLVRVPSHDPVYIKRVLDAGVDGLVVPTVESAQEARAARWGLAEIEYPARYREELVITVIVETRRGFENVEEIAAVEGIDIVFLGPGDLAADLIDDFAQLTRLGSYDIPELDRLMTEAERIVKGRDDCWMAGLARDAAGGRDLLNKGYHFVTPTADIWLLADGAKAMLEGVRG